MKLPPFAARSFRLAFWVNDFASTRPWLKKLLTDCNAWYTDAQGYRKLGLMRDDLVPEDHPVVEEALRRLTNKQLYDRTFRQVRATELSFRHEELPPELHITPEEDVYYLRPHLFAIFREQKELEQYEKGQVPPASSRQQA